jgi:hypothetical protein
MIAESKDEHEGNASSKSFTLKSENIGGLLGEHALAFRRGLNLILARNAVGASSTKDAIKLALGGEEGLEFMLHELARNGRAELIFDGEKPWSGPRMGASSLTAKTSISKTLTWPQH